MTGIDLIHHPVGVLTLRAYNRQGLELWRETKRNLIVNSGYAIILANLAGGNIGITKVAVGVNGTDPALTDESITNPILVDAVGDAMFIPGTVRFSFRIGYDDAVGVDIREFGLIASNGKLFSRRVRERLEKDNNIAISGTWDIHIVARTE